MINTAKLPESEFGLVKHYQTHLSAHVYAEKTLISHVILDSGS